MADTNFKTWLHNSTTKAMAFLASTLLGFTIWVFVQVFSQSVKHLESIDNKFDVLTKDIIAIKVNDSANTITINTLKSDVGDLKIKVGELEKSSTRHEQQIRQLNK